MKTMVCEVVGRVLVLVQGEVNPTLDDWGDYIARLAVRDYDCVLVWSDGGGPNAAQRSMLDEFWRDKEIVPAALVSCSAIRRQVITALNWLGFAKLKAFHPDDFEAALEFIGVRQHARAAISRRVFVLRDRLVRERESLGAVRHR